MKFAITKESMLNFVGESMLRSSFKEVTQDEYDEAVRTCEQKRLITRANHTRIRASLRYDKRLQGGNRGRCLIVDLPELQLKKGDRLEPSISTPDIGIGFDQIPLERFPLEVTFWRCSVESITRHSNPLFQAVRAVTLILMTACLCIKQADGVGGAIKFLSLGRLWESETRAASCLYI